MAITPGLSDRGDQAEQLQGKNGHGFAPMIELTKCPNGCDTHLGSKCGSLIN